MFLERSPNNFLSFIFIYSCFSSFVYGLESTVENRNDAIHFMRRGIGDKSAQIHGQSSQSVHHSTSATNQQSLPSLHTQQELGIHQQRASHLSRSYTAPLHPHQSSLRNVLYNQAITGANIAHPQIRQTKESHQKFDLVPVPKGLSDHIARAHVQNVQSKAYAEGNQLKGHAIIQIPRNKNAEHDLPRITIHSGRKSGQIHTSFLAPHSPPRQEQQSATHSSVHSFAHSATHSAHTQTPVTANLLDRVSGQTQPQPINQHAGDKRRRESNKQVNVDTKLRLGKRSLGETLQKRARSSSSSSDESSKARSSRYKRYSPEWRSKSRYSDSHSAIYQLKEDGHKVKGIMDIGIPSDKNAKEELPQIRIDHGHMTGKVASWITGAPERAEKKVRFQLRQGKDTYFRKPGKDVKIHSIEPYKAGFIETKSRDGHSRIMRDVDKVLKQDQKLLQFKESKARHDRYSDHSLPALHITPGTKKTRLTSAFFHREHSPVSKQSTLPSKSAINTEPSSSSLPHAGEKRKREDETKVKIGKRSIGFWKRGNSEGTSKNDSARQTSLQKLLGSVNNMKEIRSKGNEVKAISNIGVHADTRERESIPQISIRNGKKAGHVFSWTLQHPIKSISVSKRNTSPVTTSFHPDIHVSGFVKTRLNDEDQNREGYRVSHKLHALLRDGHHITKASTIETRSDPNASHKYPAIHIRPGNQHARVLSTFLTPQKGLKQSSAQPGLHMPGSSSGREGQTANLIDKLGKSNSPNHSSSSSSSKHSNPEVHRGKRPRTDLSL